MIVLMIILKSFAILGVNIGLGYLISYCLHFYLFYPYQVKILKNYQLPFSPGLLFRKKEKLITFLHLKIREYLDFSRRQVYEINFLTEFETKIFNEVYPYIKKIVDWEWLPLALSKHVDLILTQLTKLLLNQLTRKLLPFLIKEYEIKKKIDLLDLKLDIYKLKKYFEEHFYRFFLYFNLFFFVIVGFINLFLFWILC